MNRNIVWETKISISLNQVSSNVNEIYVLTIATYKQSLRHAVATGRCSSEISRIFLNIFVVIASVIIQLTSAVFSLTTKFDAHVLGGNLFCHNFLTSKLNQD